MTHDEALDKLRSILTDDFEPEPYVTLRVHVDMETVLTFDRVRGVHMENGILTFEDDDMVLTFVPTVLWWTSEYAGEWQS